VALTIVIPLSAKQLSGRIRGNLEYYVNEKLRAKCVNV
jgi:hypothetical protein